MAFIFLCHECDVNFSIIYRQTQNWNNNIRTKWPVHTFRTCCSPITNASNPPIGMLQSIAACSTSCTTTKPERFLPIHGLTRISIQISGTYSTWAVWLFGMMLVNGTKITTHANQIWLEIVKKEILLKNSVKWSEFPLSPCGQAYKKFLLRTEYPSNLRGPRLCFRNIASISWWFFDADRRYSFHYCYVSW